MNVPNTTQSARAPNEELQRRRDEIQRGVHRAGRAAVAALTVVVALAMTAAWQAVQARRSAAGETAAKHVADRAAQETREELWRSQLLDAKFYRLNGGFGQRTKDLEIIATAAAYRPTVELRNEAIAALVLPDLGTNLWWRTEDNPAPPSAFTGDLAYFALCYDNGHLAVCQASNQLPVAEFDGPPSEIWSSQFSPDSRMVAVRFRNGAVRLWDWRAGQLILAAGSLPEVYGIPTFDFTSDSRELWLIGPHSNLERYALPQGTPLPLRAMKVSASGIRLDRSGKRLLAFEGKAVSVWDMARGERLGNWSLPGEVWRAAWHPHGREFAVGTGGAGVFVGEVGQTNLDLLESSGSGNALAPTSIGFTPDGTLVLVGGWGNVCAAWDFATRKLALLSRQDWFTQLSDDGQWTAMLNERRGYGVRAFLNPVGIRRFRVPGHLVGGVNAAAWHPGGQWLVVGHQGGWSVWDAARTKLVLSRELGYCRSVQFLRDGQGFLTGGVDGPLLWPFKVVDGKPQVGEPRRLLPENSGTNERAALSPDESSFAAVGRKGAFLGALTGGRPPIPLPGSPHLGGAYDCFVAFSPDGRWIYTGMHNGIQVNIYSAATGALVTNIAAGTGAAIFVPGRDELLTQGPSDLTFWEVGTWQRLRRLPILDETSCAEFVGFWPDSSSALANGQDQMLRLWDTQTNQEIACLRLPEGSTAWAGVFDPSGRVMATTTSGPFLRLWDFPALRRELARLGLDWPDGKPANCFVPELASWTQNIQPAAGSGEWAVRLGGSRLPIWAIFSGMVLAIVFGAYMLTYQRQLFRAYGDLDRIAAARAVELAQAQGALLHSEKMKALGTMATGVAHDFNNLLSVIRLSSDLIEERTQADDVAKENFDTIQQAVQRGRGIVNSMLGYARDDGQVRRFTANDLVSEAVALLSKPFLSGLVLEIAVDRTVPELSGRKGRVEQMLLNLIVNAAEAMGGRGALRLGARAVTQPSGCVLPPRAAASYVELSVADAGPGIAPDVLPRIFEPFFTTKNKGAQHGTGLGLSMLYTIAKEDGIGVAVITEPGRGTTFLLLLPFEAVAGTPEQTRGAAAIAASEPSVSATRPLPTGATPDQT
jgi:signal transduction histidine kinase